MITEKSGNSFAPFRMNKTEVSAVVFLDLKKAFDLVDHDIVLKKLAIYLKNSSSLPFFKSDPHNRTQCILLHDSYSSEKSVKYGVPQGSVLGPILFGLFINDLPLHVKDISVDSDMLADDTTLHTSGKDIMQIRSKMQHSLDQVSNWCDNNHMVINPIKTKKYKKTTTNVCSCTRSSAMRPQGTYLTCTYTLPHAIPVLGTITLVCLGQG